MTRPTMNGEMTTFPLPPFVSTNDKNAALNLIKLLSSMKFHADPLFHIGIFPSVISSNVQVEINSENKGHDGYGLTSQRDFDGFLSLADTLMEGLHIGSLLGSQVIEDEGLFKFT
jgi:hypothetical protein